MKIVSQDGHRLPPLGSFADWKQVLDADPVPDAPSSAPNPKPPGEPLPPMESFEGWARTCTPNDPYPHSSEGTALTEYLLAARSGASYYGAAAARPAAVLGLPIGMVAGSLLGAAAQFGGTSLSGAILGLVLGGVAGPLIGATLGATLGGAWGAGIGVTGSGPRTYTISSDRIAP